jgi:hypothetical protein
MNAAATAPGLGEIDLRELTIAWLAVAVQDW